LLVTIETTEVRVHCSFYGVITLSRYS